MKFYNSRLIRFFVFCLISLTLFSCAERRVIVNNLHEREANEIIVFLSSKGIDAFKVERIEGGAGGGGPSMWNIAVNGSDVTRATALLNINGLPRRQGQNL